MALHFKHLRRGAGVPRTRDAIVPPQSAKRRVEVPVEELTNALEKGQENKNEVTNYLSEVCFFKVDTDSGDRETSCLNI